jgi:hypothetical protein
LRDLVAKLVWIRVEAKEVSRDGVKLGPELLRRQVPARPYIHEVGNDSTATHVFRLEREREETRVSLKRGAHNVLMREEALHLRGLDL